MCDRDTGESVVTRRRLLSASALAVAAGLAGCGRQGGDTTTGSGTDTTAGAGGADTTTTTGHSADVSAVVEPVPEESRCAVCNMYAADYPEWNAQATHEDGDRKFFCSPGCLTAYHATPGHFDDAHSRDDLAYEWVRAYRSREYVDATTAHYVLEETAAHVDAPMGENPVPFAQESDAQAYVDEYDDRTREDVVDLAAFDVPLARRFRARFLPEGDEPSILDPVSVPEDTECTVCNMQPANFPAWNAQASHERGDRDFFCSPGCLAAYYADPGHFVEGRDQTDIVGVWVHDHDSEDLVDGTLASYVLDTDADRTGGPMMGNPLPYADVTDARAYVDAYNDLSSEDIVPLQSLTREDASEYRAKFL